MHAGGGAHIPELVEPNLVPLLDLVLQMVMFFMATTTFVKEERTAAVKLPVASAQSAKPVEDVGSDILYINVNERGDLLLNPLDPGFNRYRDGKIDGMKNKQFDDSGKVISPGTFDRAERNRQVEAHLKRVFEDFHRDAERRADEKGVVRTLVILRAHQDANYRDVYEVLRLCRQVGFKKMQLRANIEQGK
jgi:biopolymer transport protein ExbD